MKVGIKQENGEVVDILIDNVFRRKGMDDAVYIFSWRDNPQLKTLKVGQVVIIEGIEYPIAAVEKAHVSPIDYDLYSGSPVGFLIKDK